MVNGVFKPAPGARDLSLQRGDARFQFLDGQRVEVLPRGLADMVASTKRKVVVHVHAGQRPPRR